MIKKGMAFIFVIMLVVSLAGCAPEPEPTEPPNNEKPTPEPEEVFKWTVQGFTPSGTLFQDQCEEWASLVEELSGGRIQLDVYPAGAIVPSLEGLYAVRDGVLDVHFGYSGMWIGYELAAPLFCSVPGLFGPHDMAMWLYHGGGLELWQELMDPMNIKVIPAGTISMEIFMWAHEPLRSIEDFRGKTLRMMPLMGEILQEKGAEYDIAVVFLPAAEIIPSLERKVIDAAEYSTPAFDITLGFQDICQYYHYPGIHQPTGVFEVLINNDEWNKLPDDLKRIVEHACKLYFLTVWMEGDYLNVQVLEEFEKMGLEEVVLDDETIEIFMQWADEWFEEKVKEEPFLAKVRESQVEFAKWWYQYRDKAELPFPAWAFD